MFDSGAVKVHAYFSPTLNFTGSPPAALRRSRSTTSRRRSSTRGPTPRSGLGERRRRQHSRAGVVAHARAAGRARAEVLDGRPGRRACNDSSSSPRPLPQSYLGPPESFNRWTPTKQTPVGGQFAKEARTAMSRRPTLRRTPPLARFDWFEYEGTRQRLQDAHAAPGSISQSDPRGLLSRSRASRARATSTISSRRASSYSPASRSSAARISCTGRRSGTCSIARRSCNVDSAGISRGIFAPAIRYHDGTFYMITTLIDRGGNFIVTAKNPAGPWSDPIWLRERRRHRSLALLRRRRPSVHHEQRSAGRRRRCTKATARSGCRSTTSPTRRWSGRGR